MKSRFFLFFAIVSVAGMLAMSGCHRDDDEQNGRNGRNGRTTGTLSGHDWVDLGLPSGTKWATCNVGANSPEEYGDYFAWGETAAKEIYDWNTYRWGYVSDGIYYVTKYCNKAYYGYNGFTDTLTVLEATDDAATANWGTGWRMPTGDETRELCTYCTQTWTTQNLVPGRLFTGPNGNSIFLPAAGGYIDIDGLIGYVGSDGFYMSSSLDKSQPSCEGGGIVFNSNFCEAVGGSRDTGCSVRSVCNR